MCLIEFVYSEKCRCRNCLSSSHCSMPKCDVNLFLLAWPVQNATMGESLQKNFPGLPHRDDLEARTMQVVPTVSQVLVRTKQRQRKNDRHEAQHSTGLFRYFPRHFKILTFTWHTSTTLPGQCITISTRTEEAMVGPRARGAICLLTAVSIVLATVGLRSDASRSTADLSVDDYGEDGGDDSSSFSFTFPETRSPELVFGFYDETCPDAEDIVSSTVRKLYHADPNVAAALIRLFFHDCFIHVS